MHCVAAVEYDTDTYETAYSTKAPGDYVSYYLSSIYKTRSGVHILLFA